MTYKISIETELTAKDVQEAIYDFREWVNSTDAECFEVEEVKA